LGLPELALTASRRGGEFAEKLGSVCSRSATLSGEARLAPRPCRCPSTSQSSRPTSSPWSETAEDSSFFRTAGLLRIDSIFWDVPIDPTVMRVVEGVLGPDFLLSTFSSIDLKPNGNNIQPLHPDDALIPLARPHQRPIGCTVMWVVTPFNEGTGGTRVLPGSHREPLDLLFSQDTERMSQAIQPDMKPGNVLVFDHALFHGASDNPSDDWRLGLQVSYHAGWIRPYRRPPRDLPSGTRSSSS